MRKDNTIRFIILSILIFLYGMKGYSQQLDVSISSFEVCPEEEVYITNNTPGTHTWYWAFCKADPNDQPIIDPEVNLGNISMPVYLSLNSSNDIYYLFINNYNTDGGPGNSTPGQITRYIYSTLNGTPQDRMILDIDNMPLSLEGLQIVNDENGTGEWYGFIVGGKSEASNPSYLYRLDFGTDLANPSPEIEVLFESEDTDILHFPHDLYVFYDAEAAIPAWHGFTVNREDGSIVRFDFNNGINQIPDITKLDDPTASLENPVGIFPIKDSNLDEWFVFVTDNKNGLFRLDFGTDLVNDIQSITAVDVDPLNSTNEIMKMRDISLFRSCDEIYGYLLSGEGGGEDNFVRLSFGNDLTATPQAYTYGDFGGSIKYGHSISEVFIEDDEIFAMLCNNPGEINDRNVARLILPSCTDVNTPSSYDFEPDPVSYSEPGFKTIEVICDYGLASQQNECFTIEVKALPDSATHIYGNTVVCPGDTLIYYIDPQNHTDEYHWNLDTGLSALSATDHESIEVAISTSISPGPHTIEVYGENECGYGPTHLLEIQVDTATVIDNHPFPLLTIDVGDAAEFTVLAVGTNLQYQWEESIDGGVTWNPLNEAFPYSGVYTNTLVITDVDSDMTGNEYRCVVQGSCAPIEVVSGECILVVGALKTTVGDANAADCPDVDVDIPVKVIGFSAVDTFNITFSYNTDLEYLDFDNVHDKLSGLNVENPAPGTLAISWSSSDAETILSGKMVNLNFHTHIGADCDFTFDESQCEYFSANTKLDDDYETYSFTILPLPATPSSISGSFDRCEGRETISYEIPTPLYTDSYSWVLSPNTAGDISGTTNPVTITWDEYFNGETWLKVKGNNNCGEGEYGDSVKIITNPLPLKAAMPQGDTNLCMAGPSTTYMTNGGDYATEYFWRVNPPEAGTASGTSTECMVTWNPEWVGFAEVTAMSVNGCGDSRENSDPILVDVNPLPDMDLWVSDTVVYLDAPVSFNANVWQGDAPYSYHWDFMSGSWYSSRADTTIIPDDPYHEYELIVVDSNNCVMTKTIGVKILLPMFVPNAFTPDQDGLNDNFKAFVTGNVEGVRYRMFVYSRNGQQLFYEEGDELALMQGWDGTVNGEYQPSGVYIYYIFYEIMGYDGREGEQLLKGSFTLLR